MLASVFEPTTFAVVAGAALCLGLLLNYLQARNAYHKEQTGGNPRDLPPLYPTLIPYFGVIVPFLWDTPAFLQRVTSYAGRLTSLRIRVAPRMDIYLFQDQETVKEIWKNSAMMCAGRVHVWACKYLFGMPDKWLAKYAADNSGPFIKPYPGSNIPPHMRIHRLLNEGIEKALTGPGFEPTLQRFRKALISQMEQVGASNEDWVEVGDFRKFIHNTVGRSLVQALFGPSILQINPGLMNDLYDFDQSLPWLSRAIPRFIMPNIYTVRERLHEQFKKWYEYARSHFDESSISDDRDGDPYWGSNWMRERQKTLDILQDDDTLAAGDLGVAWASVANVVSASTMALVHIANIPEFSDRIRADVSTTFAEQSLAEVDLKTLSNIPLLASMYAETLRLHAKSFTVVSSPVQDTYLGGLRLPKDSIGLINAHVSHMDETFWNTKEGKHPLQSFWPQRFLVDPNDESSGPSRFTRQLAKRENPEATAPYFSLKGLEGAWIPYGGGQLICPGRFLAKNVMIFTCALLTQEFDIEVLTKEIKFSKKWFGFGTEIPEHAISIRIKRKSTAGQKENQ